MNSILFADDDTRVLSGLRRQLHKYRTEWEVVFAPGGPEAITAVDEHVFDAVVTDMRMPVVDGAQVLSKVAAEQPYAARLVLSGQADPDRDQLAVSCAHRYLHKPCAPDILVLEVQQALMMREDMESLADERLSAMWSQPPYLLPSGGSLLTAVMSECAELPDDVAELMREDAALWSAARSLLSIVLDRDVDPAVGQDDAPVPLQLALLQAVRFRRFFGATDDAAVLELASRAVGGARALDPDLGPPAALAATLWGLATSCSAPAWSEVLAYLLPTWGYDDTVIAAVTGTGSGQGSDEAETLARLLRAAQDAPAPKPS